MELNLSIEQYKTLAAQAGEQVGVCSPFYNAASRFAGVAGMPLAPEITNNLRAEGVLDVLVNPACSVAYSYTGVDFAFRAAQYTAGGGSRLRVSVADTDNGVNIASPSAIDVLLEMVEQYIGTSLVVAADAEETITYHEASAFFSLLDAARRKQFQALSSGQAMLDNPYPTLEDVSRAADPRVTDLQWLSAMLRETSGIQANGPGEIMSGLQSLSDKGWLNLRSDSVEMSPQMNRLHTQLLLVESYSNLQAACGTTEQDLQRMDIWCVRGRGQALLSWSMDDTSITLQSLSPAQWLALVGSFLKEPLNIFKEVNQEPSAESQQPAGEAGPGEKQCPSCGAAVQGDKKFCTKCGYSFT